MGTLTWSTPISWSDAMAPTAPCDTVSGRIPRHDQRPHRTDRSRHHPPGCVARLEGLRRVAPMVAELALFSANPTPTGSLSLAPLSALDRQAPRDRYIVSTHEPRGEQESAEQITLEDLKASIRRVLGVDLPVEDGHWLRSTVANSRQAEQYRVGPGLSRRRRSARVLCGRLVTERRDARRRRSRGADLLGARRVRRRSSPSTRTTPCATSRASSAILQTRAQAALSGAGRRPGMRVRTRMRSARFSRSAFRTRNPSRYLATLLIGE